MVWPTHGSRKAKEQNRTGNGVRRVNEVTLRRVRLVLGWVTVCGYAVLVRSKSLRPTQPRTLSETGNEYRPRSSGSALRS